MKGVTRMPAPQGRLSEGGDALQRGTDGLVGEWVGRCVHMHMDTGRDQRKERSWSNHSLRTQTRQE